MNLNFGKCKEKRLSEKAGMRNWGTEWGEWWECGESEWEWWECEESEWECGEWGWESLFRLIFEKWNYKGYTCKTNPRKTFKNYICK